MMTRSTGKSWLHYVVLGTLSALATFIGFEVFLPVRLPPAMQGQWRVVEGKDLSGATLVFQANGCMIGTVLSEGKEATIHGRVALDGNRFRVTTVSPAGGEAVTEAEEILDLTERRFVVQDAHGEVLIMERPLSTGGVR